MTCAADENKQIEAGVDHCLGAGGNVEYLWNMWAILASILALQLSLCVERTVLGTQQATLDMDILQLSPDKAGSWDATLEWTFQSQQLSKERVLAS